VTVDTECADVPTPNEVGSNAAAYDDLATTILLSSLCWDSGSIRSAWPDGITRDEALGYAARVCSAGPGVLPTPQEWYATNGGPSTAADDFASAISQEVLASRSRGFGVC